MHLKGRNVVGKMNGCAICCRNQEAVDRLATCISDLVTRALKQQTAHY